MVKSLYDYTYTNPSGYKYTGQVVSDTEQAKYAYVSGQTYAAPQGGSYAITGAGAPTSAPSGAVYQKTYTDAAGKTYDSWKYDVKDNAYYNVNSGYDTTTGLLTPPAGAPGTPAKTPVPAWTGIGLGEEYGYANIGTPAAPDYQSYGGGGWANVSLTPGVVSAYNFKFTYPNGDYYLGKAYDDGTYGYDVGKTYDKGVGKYEIYSKDTAPPAANYQAGWTNVQLYHEGTTNYPPSDIIPTSPWYNKPTGVGGLGSEKAYIQKPGGYYSFDESGPASASTAIAAIPLPT